MTNWRSDRIDTNGIRLHYMRTGGDRPPLILAHGFTDASLCWTPVAEALSATYDVIMVDARGHGHSDGPEQGYRLTDLAADLAGVITGLSLHRPAILGHSMGGATTLALAGTYPELPGVILIEDAGLVNMTSSQTPADQERYARMRNGIIELKRKTRDELIAGIRANAPGWSEAERGPWAEAKLRFSLYALKRIGAGVADAQAVLGRITCPALLLTADPERGAIVTEAEAKVMRELIPQLRVIHIPGAGHNIRREQFAHYIDLVSAFLSETVS